MWGCGVSGGKSSEPADRLTIYYRQAAFDARLFLNRGNVNVANLRIKSKVDGEEGESSRNL
ncbi:MAG: hypothetical protein DRO09_02120 [Thermoprotei archaeon]|nr:MAG: hypothetical protein DRO09_02120 [Thermoprotei archaeon]